MPKPVPRPVPRPLLLPLLILAALFIPACGKSPANPSPTPSTLDARASMRIITLAPALGVMCEDLGLGGQIVGRHAWDLALDPAIPTVGTHDDPDLEAILRLEPTHILVQDMEARVPESLTRLAADQGWQVWSFPLLALDDIAQAMDEIDRRVYPDPEPEKSLLNLSGFDPTERLAAERPSARLADAWSDRGEAADGAGRVLLLASTDPPGAMGPGSFHHQLLERLGATPALTTGGPWQELDHEDLLRLAPDAILVFRPRGRDEPAGVWTPQAVRAALGGVAELNIPAVRTGRIVVIDHPLGLLPASSLSEVAEDMAAAFDRWQGSAP
jgi:ABC-type Fe3+-hydroxamate transport system substrate-binding protein